MVLLLNEAGDLVTNDTENAEILNAFFASVFTSKTSLQKSQAPETRRKVWSKENSPLAEKDQATILVDGGKTVDVVYFDFSKAFDIVSHNILIHKLTKYRWVEIWLNYQAQRVVIHGTKSSWKPATSGVPQGLKLWPIQINIFINDFDTGTKYTFSRFADNKKLGGVADTPEGCTAIPWDLNRLESWAERNVMKLSKRKCKVLYLGRYNAGFQYMLRVDWLESSSAEKDLGVPTDNKMNMSLQCTAAAKEVNSLLSCIRQSVASKSREVGLLLYSHLVRHIGVLGPVLGSQYKKDAEQVQCRATKIIKRLEHLSYKERLTAWRGLGGILSTSKGSKGDGVRLFSVIPTDRTRGNEQKFKKMKFNLNTRKHFLLGAEHRHRLPREVAESPPVEIFKTQPYTVMGNWLYLTLL
ncbi:LOW QUALITY PROTEIN: hypothetical protein QYF61_024594 [Mycteria americana]|uniref:Reverse transcriptase domain-containing protein n=1 Tax=Mycteria americana TaxID=33587 RepID=A0AAN7PWM0_MYCAM|nr:LOW QUALITY PROTEIN: hypothetical protein QYF61_024594 [Mycteria americana]